MRNWTSLDGLGWHFGKLVVPKVMVMVADVDVFSPELYLGCIGKLQGAGSVAKGDDFAQEVHRRYLVTKGQAQGNVFGFGG